MESILQGWRQNQASNALYWKRWVSAKSVSNSEENFLLQNIKRKVGFIWNGLVWIRVLAGLLNRMQSDITYMYKMIHTIGIDKMLEFFRVHFHLHTFLWIHIYFHFRGMDRTTENPKLSVELLQVQQFTFCSMSIQQDGNTWKHVLYSNYYGAENCASQVMQRKTN